MKEKAYFNWSSGKDSALALYKAIVENRYEISTLFTIINAETGHIPMHEIRLDLLKKQSESIGVPLTAFHLRENTSPDEYKQSMEAVMDDFKAKGLGCAIFGDIYMEELRNKRVRNCIQSGIRPVFPLWNRPTAELLREFIDLGFKAVITSVDASVLDESFVGRILDHGLIDSFPAQADIGGEGGEYHSFVFDGPIFRKPVPFRVSATYYRDYPAQDGGADSNRFWYARLE